MVEPVSVGVTIAGYLAKTFGGRKIDQLLSNVEQRQAFKRAMQAALDRVIDEGFSPKGPGALDVSFLGSEVVWEELWKKLLDPTIEEKVDYPRLGQALRDIYPKAIIGDRERESVEFFVDSLIDRIWGEASLSDLLSLKIRRQHDLTLTAIKKKALIRDYLRAEGQAIRKQLDDDLGEGNRYVEPLIEKKEEKKRERAEAVEETESFVPIDMNTYFTGDPDRKMVVVADSGYGKTTLLRELFIRISRFLEGRLFGPDSPIPIYLTPSQAAECSETNIVDKVTIRLRASGCRESKVRRFVEDELERGGFVFLVDALDQVSNRENLRGALEGRAFRENRVVVTTRPNVWEMEKGHFTNYVYLQIREFDESRWEEYLGKERLRVLREIVDEDFLSVPILLRLIVEYLSQRDRETESIRNRADLYTRVFDRLLKRQEDIDAAKAAIGKGRSLFDVRADLCKLAHDGLCKNFLGQFPRSDGKEILGEEWRLADLEARRGIVEAGAEITFQHRSFQEYLAAEYLKSTIKTEEDLDNLEPYLFHPNWEESLRFLVGLLPVKNAECLIDRLLSLAEGEPLFLYRDHLRFASLCLREIGEKAGQTQRKIIIEQLAEDLGNPTLQYTAITVLSALEDKKAVDLLGALLMHQDSAVRWRAADALGQIKSEKAVEAVIKALQDPEDYVRRRAANTLGQIKSEKAVEALIKALQDPGAYVRWNATDALGQIKSDKAVEALIKTLQDPKPDVRRRVADTLGEIKSEKAVEPLIKALQDPEAEIRRSAAYALGEIKSEKAVEPLIKALQDPKVVVRERAADALGEIKSEKAVEALIKALQDPKPDVRRRVADTLGEIKSEKAVEPLIKALQDPEAEVRWAAVYALGQIKPEKAVEALIKALQNPEAEVRWSTADALGQIKPEKAVEPLIKALQDPEAEVRRSAALALGRIKPEKAVEALIKALQDPGAYVRWNATDALGQIKSDKAVEALIKTLQDPKPDVRRRVADTLGEIKSEKAVEPLIKALQDPEAEIRRSAAYALGEIKSEKAVEPLIKALQDPKVVVRERAADALGEIKSEKAVEPLIKALQDPEAFVRKSAAYALGEIRSEEAVEPLIKALQDPEAAVRWSAAVALGRIKSEKAVEALIKALQDPEAHVRGRAADTLAQIESEKAVEPLIKALRDPDYVVRGTAAEALGQIKSDRVVEPLTKALQDPEVVVRSSAAEALGRIKSEKAVEALIKTLQHPKVDVRGRAASVLGDLGSKQTLAKLVDAWNQESSVIDRPLLLDAIRSCDRKVRSEQPIMSAGNKQFK